MKRRLERRRTSLCTTQVTRNFESALPYLDRAFAAEDREVVHMAQWLLHRDGLFLGSSGCLNCVGPAPFSRSCAASPLARRGAHGSRISTDLGNALKYLESCFSPRRNHTPPFANAFQAS